MHEHEVPHRQHKQKGNNVGCIPIPAIRMGFRRSRREEQFLVLSEVLFMGDGHLEAVCAVPEMIIDRNGVEC